MGKWERDAEEEGVWIQSLMSEIYPWHEFSWGFIKREMLATSPFRVEGHVGLGLT